MNEEFERNEEQFASVLKQYETMIRENKVVFFDLEQFEEIFDHYYAKNKVSKAEKVLSIALEQHPYSGELKMRQAQILMRRKKYEKAIDILDKLLLIEPGNADLYLLLAEAYSDKGNMEKAVECYLQALPFMDREEHDYVFMDIAGEYLSHSEYEKALEYLQKALKVNPHNDLIYLDILFACQVLEEVEKALEIYRKQVDRDPYNHLAWFYMGVALADADRNTEAIEAFDFAMVIDPNFSEAFYQKAEILMSLGKYEEAILVLKDLNDESKMTAASCYMLGECYENLAEWHDALHYYRLSTRLDPNFSDAWLSIGVVIYKLGSIDEALGYVLKALRLDPNNVDALLYLGDIKKEAGAYPEALEAYEKAALLDNAVIDLWLNYSDLFVQMDDLDMAIDIIREGCRNIPESAELKYRWGAYEYMKGNRQGAYMLIDDAAMINAKIAETELLNFFPLLRNDVTIQNIIYRNLNDEN